MHAHQFNWLLNLCYTGLLMIN